NEPGVLLVLRATLDGEQAFNHISAMDRSKSGMRSLSGALGDNKELMIFFPEAGEKQVVLSAMHRGQSSAVFVKIEVPAVKRFEHTIALESATIVGKVSPPAGAGADFSLTGVFIDHESV